MRFMVVGVGPVTTVVTPPMPTEKPEAIPEEEQSIVIPRIIEPGAME